MVVGLQAISRKPLRFALFLRDQSHDIFVQTARNSFGLDVGGESVFVFVAEVGNYLISFFHLYARCNLQRYKIALKTTNFAPSFRTI